jgi:uncharacterized membrane protein YgdD (TMEM256/DUF423 family)
MNSELQKELLNIINSSKEFVLTQAPDVFQQTIAYGIYSNTVALFIFSGFLLLGCFGLFMGYRRIKNEYARDFWILVGAPVGGVMLLIGLIGVVCSYDELLQVKMAPKLYLIQTLAPKQK